MFESVTLDELCSLALFAGLTKESLLLLKTSFEEMGLM